MGEITLQTPAQPAVETTVVGKATDPTVIEAPVEAPSEKTFTQEDVNKIITDRLAKEQKKFNATLEEKLSEAQKLAKMGADEKAKYEKEKFESLLAKRETEITKRELKATAKDTLLSKGLPIELAETLVYTDAETCNASIEAVAKAFEIAVTKSVNEKLKQDPPKTGPTQTSTIKKIPTVF